MVNFHRFFGAERGPGELRMLVISWMRMEHIARWRRHARGNGYRCCVSCVKCDECPNQTFSAISDAVISSHLRVRTSSQRGAAMKASSRASTHFSLMERILRATRAVAQHLVPHDLESETQAMLTAVINDELTPI